MITNIIFGIIIVAFIILFVCAFKNIKKYNSEIYNSQKDTIINVNTNNIDENDNNLHNLTVDNTVNNLENDMVEQPISTYRVF